MQLLSFPTRDDRVWNALDQPGNPTWGTYFWSSLTDLEMKMKPVIWSARRASSQSRTFQISYLRDTLLELLDWSRGRWSQACIWSARNPTWGTYFWSSSTNPEVDGARYEFDQQEILPEGHTSGAPWLIWRWRWSQACNWSARNPTWGTYFWSSLADPEMKIEPGMHLISQNSYLRDILLELLDWSGDEDWAMHTIDQLRIASFQSQTFQKSYLRDILLELLDWSGDEDGAEHLVQPIVQVAAGQTVETAVAKYLTQTRQPRGAHFIITVDKYNK